MFEGAVPGGSVSPGRGWIAGPGLLAIAAGLEIGRCWWAERTDPETSRDATDVPR